MSYYAPLPEAPYTKPQRRIGRVAIVLSITAAVSTLVTFFVMWGWPQ